MTLKRSRTVSLVMISSVSLVACGDSTPQSRYQYSSQQECLLDWNDPQLCEEGDDDDFDFKSKKKRYYGPTLISRAGQMYFKRKGMSADFPMPSHLSSGSTRAVATKSFSASRGGFGASARSSSGS